MRIINDLHFIRLCALGENYEKEFQSANTIFMKKWWNNDVSVKNLSLVIGSDKYRKSCFKEYNNIT